MNFTNWITMRNATGFMAIAGCLLYAMSAIATDIGTTADCQAEWDDAPAEAYCTDTSIEAVLRGDASDTDRSYTACKIAVSSCTIAVNIGSDSNSTSYTFTPSWDSNFSTQGLCLPEVDLVDICFRSSNSTTPVPTNATSAQAGWVAYVGQMGCNFSSTTGSATATTDGLAGP